MKRYLSSFIYHIPVLKKECSLYLNIKLNGLYIDCTLGGGGHTLDILKQGGKVIGIDQDIDSIKLIENNQIFQEFILKKQLELKHDNFQNIVDIFNNSYFKKDLNINQVDGILLDLGVSSHQIDSLQRGFTYKHDISPLDMRMFQDNSSNTDSITAYDLINNLSVEELANIFYKYGEERRSRQIATEIISFRPHKTAGTVRECIERVTRPQDQIKTLSRCFQALRIVVNNELECLEKVLKDCHKIVKVGGRLVVLSYHSLEDRQIKQLLQPKQIKQSKQKRNKRSDSESENENENNEIESNNDNNNNSSNDNQIFWKPIFKGVIQPSYQEIQQNSRSRSAKLRVGERI